MRTYLLYFSSPVSVFYSIYLMFSGRIREILRQTDKNNSVT